MRLIGKTERAHGIVDETNFVLPALTQPMLGKDDKVPIRAYRVTFGEGGRTYWHSHSDTQILFGLSGQCLVRNRAGDEAHLHPGDMVIIEGGEEHWHGASPGTDGEHLAINLGSHTEWLESSG
ncbi:MAG: cupin [Gemmatimonadetes bacterium]|mgnify:FL=1|jgi:quercetin dioxygenase-like cupin family protein|nr:cupin [Gemmatimonadota bacterium]MCH2452394.1 cupin domain-containing protein [Gemmatimonadota bacterium]MEE2879756.1 cupin domain-containing protein [Gemmatimonadota bacterium]|tara:strand:+ start:2066 stop:2434 length:369 start_codon:yes stop_codon:yes gene_type:complete